MFDKKKCFLMILNVWTGLFLPSVNQIYIWNLYTLGTLFLEMPFSFLFHQSTIILRNGQPFFLTFFLFHHYSFTFYFSRVNISVHSSESNAPKSVRDISELIQGSKLAQKVV
ncbi:unnamed protein product [Meloidogyne enterolobii]|uniref:Uncharacterized protein n=1 Tax=Meloidogyne enterolobii TaxID=390850 RepID=A0ACB1ATX4_MELEN